MAVLMFNDDCNRPHKIVPFFFQKKEPKLHRQIVKSVPRVLFIWQDEGQQWPF